MWAYFLVQCGYDVRLECNKHILVSCDWWRRKGHPVGDCFKEPVVVDKRWVVPNSSVFVVGSED